MKTEALRRVLSRSEGRLEVVRSEIANFQFDYDYWEPVVADMVDDENELITIDDCLVEYSTMVKKLFPGRWEEIVRGKLESLDFEADERYCRLKDKEAEFEEEVAALRECLAWAAVKNGGAK
jgi:hypothetical protein